MGGNSLIASGLGLITLDVIVNGKPRDYVPCFTGGSTGNVLTILSYFGWKSYPFAFIGDDAASNIMIDDMEKWGVNTNYIVRNETISTPIILEKLSKRGHTFKFTCPICANKYPRNRVLPTDVTDEIISNLPDSKIFYFDRISKSLLTILKSLKEEVIVFFEPHRVSKINLFKKVLKHVDIIKYSSENIPSLGFNHKIPLEIQTKGKKGLKFKIKAFGNKWSALPAFELSTFVDAAGSGDWLSAGLLDKIGRNHDNVSELDEQIIYDYLNYGQRLSAFNCFFEGPRSIMYHLKKSSLLEIVNGDIIPEKPDFSFIKLQNDFSGNTYALDAVCPNCNR